MKKFRKEYACAFVFIAFIGMMLVLFAVLPGKTYLTDEKRKPAEMPSLTWRSLRDGTFGDDMDSYISDNFAGRKFFVGLNAYYDYISGRGGTLDIYNAKDGYLINGPVTPDTERLSRNIDIIDRFAEHIDSRVYLCVVPSAAYVMEDRLPCVHMPYHDDELLDIIEDGLSDSVTYVDLAGSFREYSGNEPLFYRTDHHWTTYGAYEGYVEICKSMGIEAASREDFTVSRYEGFYGTTYSQSGYWLTEPDTVEIWERNAGADAGADGKGSGVTVYIEENGKVVKQRDSLYFTEHLSEPDMYPVFVDGNHPLVRIINENAPEGRLVVIKDSFAHCLVPFLSEHYREIDMIDLRYYKGSSSDIVNGGSGDKCDVLFVYGLDDIVNDSNFPWLTRDIMRSE